MLHDFLDANRGELIIRCRAKVAVRSAAGEASLELPHGITVFLDQLITTLRVEEGTNPASGVQVSGPASGLPARSEIGEKATQHGSELLDHGYSIESVVHDYGDLCQAITDLALETDEPITTVEFRTLNRCLDNAIATSVTEFSYARDRQVGAAADVALSERLGFLAHELRNSLSTATLSVALIRSGHVGMSGATGSVLDRSLVQMKSLIDRSLAEARLASGSVLDTSVFSVAGFISEARAAAALEASLRERCLIVPSVDVALRMSGDRDLLLGALGNLLHNAFKFTGPDGEVTLTAFAVGDRIHIDIADCCGGLKEGIAEAMFEPFRQMGSDRSGAGLGLAIARRSVEANGGALTVRNMPGHGCVFTIEVPRQQSAQVIGRQVTDLLPV